MDGAGNEMDTADVDHGLPFDVIFLFVKHSRYRGGTVKLIIIGGGGGESVGYYEEGGFRKTEGGGAGVGASQKYFPGRRRENKTIW